MKLSEAIEKMLVCGEYERQAYMCFALSAHQMYGHVLYVRKMVSSIHRASCTLDGALRLRGIKVPEDHVQFCKQFYCWWVFDLKRKGL